RVFGVGISLKVVGGLLGAVAIAILAPLSHLIWAHGLTGPMLVAALLPVAQAPEGIAAAALIVRRRYDVRAAFLVVSMALRLAALAGADDPAHRADAPRRAGPERPRLPDAAPVRDRGDAPHGGDRAAASVADAAPASDRVRLEGRAGDGRGADHPARGGDPG